MGSVYFYRAKEACEVRFGSLFAWDYLKDLAMLGGDLQAPEDQQVFEDENVVTMTFGVEASRLFAQRINDVLADIPSADSRSVSCSFMPDFPMAQGGQRESLLNYWGGRRDDLEKLARFFEGGRVTVMLDC